MCLEKTFQNYVLKFFRAQNALLIFAQKWLCAQKKIFGRNIFFQIFFSRLERVLGDSESIPEKKFEKFQVKNLIFAQKRLCAQNIFFGRKFFFKKFSYRKKYSGHIAVFEQRSTFGPIQGCRVAQGCQKNQKNMQFCRTAYRHDFR